MKEALESDQRRIECISPIGTHLLQTEMETIQAANELCLENGNCGTIAFWKKESRPANKWIGRRNASSAELTVFRGKTERVDSLNGFPPLLLLLLLLLLLPLVLFSFCFSHAMYKIVLVLFARHWLTRCVAKNVAMMMMMMMMMAIIKRKRNLSVCPSFCLPLFSY